MALKSKPLAFAPTLRHAHVSFVIDDTINFVCGCVRYTGLAKQIYGRPRLTSGGIEPDMTRRAHRLRAVPASGRRRAVDPRSSRLSLGQLTTSTLTPHQRPRSTGDAPRSCAALGRPLSPSISLATYKPVRAYHDKCQYAAVSTGPPCSSLLTSLSSAQTRRTGEKSPSQMKRRSTPRHIHHA